VGKERKGVEEQSEIVVIDERNVKKGCGYMKERIMNLVNFEKFI